MISKNRTSTALGIRAATLAIATALLGLALTGSARADFGFTDVNQPGAPTAPAFPGTSAVWAGTCDLSSASTSNGGVGVAPSGRLHCLDIGDISLPSAAPSPWTPGKEPSWRLDPITQAGAHGDATASFFFRRAAPLPVQDGGTVRDIVAKLPPGVVGSPEAVTKCSALAVQTIPPFCGPESQLGVSTIRLISNLGLNGGGNYPVYAVEARDTVTAEFIVGSIVQLFNVPITARGRTNGDYGVDTLALLIPDYTGLLDQTITLWGVPWSREHDKYRVDARTNSGGSAGSFIPTAGYSGYGPKEGQAYSSSWGPIKPFFTTPTECSGKPLPVQFDVNSWQEQDKVVVGTVETDVVTGCDKLEFDPAIELRPTVSVADSASGLDVTVATPQNNDPPAEIPGNPDLAHDPDPANGAPAYWRSDAGLATAHLKDTVVRLPKGTSFNPAAANGLRGCTTEQMGLTAVSPKVTFNNDPITCPETAKIGTLEINSPLLPDPLLGAVYAAPQSDNPFPGSLTAIYLVAQDEERGLSVKLPGKVDLDPATGQISTTFVDNPQLPFENFVLHLKSGPRAPLNTPATCGQFENSAELIPWSFPESGPQPTIHDPFPISAMPNGLSCVSQPEDRVFAPGFEAGSSNVRAAAHTDYVLNVTRRDGEQEISGISLDLPSGVVGNLSQIAYCPEASIAGARTRTGLQETIEPSCPPSSYVGRVDTLAGAGSLPLPTAGRLYLSGPYDPDGAGPSRQSPLSVTTIVPAIAGGVPGDPAFDLGNVVIRTGINLDPQTAQVHIDSTDVPYIVGGVPLRIRSIGVNLDRPEFMLNPTNCDPETAAGSIRGSADPLNPADDVFRPVSSRFQVEGCRDLGFKPKLALRLRGGTKRGQYPQLTATLTPRPGDANLKSISVALPPSEFLAQNHIRTICTRVQFAEDTCPEGSVYGFARAFTPLLRDPLEGPVILKSSNNPLPDLVLDLRGQLDLQVVGRIDSVNGGIRTTFDVAPDAPVSKFVLRMKAGRKSLLTNSRDICAGRRVVKRDGKRVSRRLAVPAATVSFLAHNGIALTRKAPLVAAGCKKAGKRPPGQRG